MNGVRLVTLDETEPARDALSLAVLRKAGEGHGPYAEAARLAAKEYDRLTSSGTAHSDAMLRAREVMHAALPGRR